MKKDLLFDLLLTFMKIGLFTFGGGYAMIAMIESYCVERKRWITHDDMMNVTVIAESTPGPIAINCATFVGQQQAGSLGALIATLGIILPSFALIYAISMYLDNFLDVPVITSAFKGIKIAVGLLILDAAVTMIKKMHRRVLPYGIMTCSFVVMLLVNVLSWDVSSISLMSIAAAVSLVISSVSLGGRRYPEGHRQGEPGGKGGCER